MTNNIYIFVFLFSVFISSVSQILLKKTANDNSLSGIKVYFNLYIAIAYFIFFLSTLISMYALKYIPLSLAAILETSGYFWITIFGKIFLQEIISRNKLIGISLIIIGIIVFNI